MGPELHRERPHSGAQQLGLEAGGGELALEIELVVSDGMNELATKVLASEWRGAGSTSALSSTSSTASSPANPTLRAA
jgi:hypothetical protein